jgi:hypothetical protein
MAVTQAKSAKAARASKARQTAKKAVSRVRKKAATASAPAPTDETKGDPSTPRPASLMGLAALTVAIILGAAGFAIHIFWVGAIVVMAVLWGSMISGRQVGARNPRGVVSEVVTAAVGEVREITDSLSGRNTKDVRQVTDV